MVQHSTFAKYYRITIDNKLSFKQPIIFLENKITCSVRIIAKVSCYLPINTLVAFYYALVDLLILAIYTNKTSSNE